MADQRLIPSSIRDASTLAFNELIERMGTLDIRPLLVYLIDDVTASALPHLAEQFHVTGYEGWLLAASDADKRALIKNSIELHRYKGTPYAIKKVLETLGLSGTVLEWFQYGGQPYHFKVWVDIGERGMQADTLTALDQMITAWKNVRSWLDVINLRLSVVSPVPVLACAITSGETVTLDPWYTPEVEASGTYVWATVLQSVETITINP